MVVRHGVTNKNILSSFVKLANALDWPIYVEHSDRLMKDQNFPKMQTLIEEGASQFYQIEKRNGQWQIQKVDDTTERIEPITVWTPTRRFEEVLSITAQIAEENKKRNQV